MAQQIQAPVLINPIPNMVTYEVAAFGPFDLRQYVYSNEVSGPMRFGALLSDGKALPQGLMCTEDGLISGIPAHGTKGNYDIALTVENNSEIPLLTNFKFTIKEQVAYVDTNLMNQLKAQVWDALGHDLPIPDISEFMNTGITPAEIYYLLERYATLTIWDIYNMSPPGKKVLLKLEGANPHYNIYDRGSCLVVAPVDLFSHQRTLEDALEASRVAAREVYKRGWTVELAGFNKLTTAAWVEIQLLGDKHGKKLEIFNYKPSDREENIYRAQASRPGFTP